MRVPGQKFFVPASRLITGMSRSYNPKMNYIERARTKQCKRPSAVFRLTAG